MYIRIWYMVFVPLYTFVYFFDWIIYALLYMFKRRHLSAILGLWQKVILIHPESCFYLLLTVGSLAVWGSHGLSPVDSVPSIWRLTLAKGMRAADDIFSSADEWYECQGLYNCLIRSGHPTEVIKMLPKRNTYRLFPMKQHGCFIHHWLSNWLRKVRWSHRRL